MPCSPYFREAITDPGSMGTMTQWKKISVFGSFEKIRLGGRVLPFETSG